MLEFAHVDIGGTQIVSCAACRTGIDAAEARTAALLATELAAIAASWRRAPGPNVAFIGREAFAHPELPAVVDACTAAGFERVRLSTDAAALARHDNARGVLGAGVRHFEVTLLGGDATTHDAFVGRRGAFDATVSGMEALRAAASTMGTAVCITGRVPVCAHTMTALPGAVAVLAARGASAVELAFAGKLDLRKAAPWVEAAAETGTVNACWVFADGASIDAAYPYVPAAVLERPWSRAVVGA